MSEESVHHRPLIQHSSSHALLGEENHFRRRGNVWSAVAHIITGVIGAGVLSLAWSVAQLGWIGGPITIILFAFTTFLSAYFLSDCHKFPHPQHGIIRSSSYMDAVKLYLGETRHRLCGGLVLTSLFGTTIAYIITSTTSIRYDNDKDHNAITSFLRHQFCILAAGFNYGEWNPLSWMLGEKMAVQNSLQIARNGRGAYDDDGRVKRTGTLWSAVAHIITAIIGAGVLSLAWSTSQLGWIAGPVFLLFCAFVTYISSFLLSDCYRILDPVTGKRNYSYISAVRIYLGNKRTWLAGFLQFLSLYGACTAYVITTATCLRAILKSNCYHKEGHQAPCKYGDSMYMVLFGLVQVVMSFIPDLHNMVWVSVVAAIMSFTYASIGLGLGITTVIQNGRIMGSVTGVPASNIVDKLWLVFQALGDIAFAYPYTVILLEIQDTLKSPPPENNTMKKASMIAILITTFFYLCCACFGYAAFGDQTPGNLLTGFGFFEPYWLIDFANACIVLHLVGGYQIYCQPIYGAVDRWCSRKYPNNGFVNNLFRLKLPLLPAFQINMFRICFRTAYVISTTGLAILFPYFNQVLGVLGALSFWPLAIYFPVEMYFVQKKIEAWSRKWIVLRTFSLFCFLVSLLGLVGSLEGIISEKLS
ncbi:hypothetical protein VNO77_29629 [Canavalia gladiata]|uniref:Amino acid transporter transmembrane domain-containing protein n=1 Tax=Canavalia gladiata TaxID=3824 RepID=A0AAN9KQA4_CANGL